MEAISTKSPYEIERGKPMPSKNHAIIQRNLLIQLFQNYVDRFEVLPEINLLIGGKKRVPDLAFFKNLNFDAKNDEIWVKEIPLCVVEILSPPQSLTELMTKSAIYFENGVASYWLAIPDLRAIVVFSGVDEYELYAKTDQLIDTKLDIQLDLKDIFK